MYLYIHMHMHSQSPIYNLIFPETGEKVLLKMSALLPVMQHRSKELWLLMLLSQDEDVF